MSSQSQPTQDENDKQLRLQLQAMEDDLAHRIEQLNTRFNELLETVRIPLSPQYVSETTEKTRASICEQFKRLTDKQNELMERQNAMDQFIGFMTQFVQK